MASERKIRALIVDDEPLARQRIADLLAKEPDVEIAGTASDGLEAVEAIRRLSPDLVFLDVQMPGLSGMQVVDAIGSENMPETVFVTAFDRFALDAFDRAALDYLVKPFDDDRFGQAFQRARRMIDLEKGEPSAKSDSLDRIPVESRGQVRVVPVERIDYITASGPYAELHVGDRVFAVRERMQTLEERLDPDVFFRIHRSAIVRLDQIEAVTRQSGGDYGVRLKNGVELSLSRGRREELEQKLGIAR
ncbi:MAG TPA: response regulator [Thermoanaerobaculia bacterium]|nr:response regulator [Thermoanaerobaculia bacterium]